MDFPIILPVSRPVHSVVLKYPLKLQGSPARLRPNSPVILDFYHRQPRNLKELGSSPFIPAIEIQNN